MRRFKLKSSIALLSVIFASISLCAQEEPATAHRSQGRRDFYYVQVMTYSYVGDINGLRAVAQVSFENLGEYVMMTGVIQSGPYTYTLSGDIYGDSGYGDIRPKPVMRAST